MNQSAWVAKRMPLTKRAVELLDTELKTAGLVGASALLCSHVEWKFTHLAKLLSQVMNVRVVGNTRTTCLPECVESLRQAGIEVFDSQGLNSTDHRALLERAIDKAYTVAFDDGAHAIPVLCSRQETGPKTLAATEYTMTGMHRVRKMAGTLSIPVFDLNSSLTKRVIGNRYGTGISTVTSFLYMTNMALAGLRVAVLGYGPVGQSVAHAFRGLGAVVTVHDPNNAQQAVARLDGFATAKLRDTAASCDVFITCTGRAKVLGEAEFNAMPNDAILGNVGHDDVEIDLPQLSAMSTSSRQLTPFITEYTLANGRSINLLCNGALLNLSAGFGFPVETIDYSFAAAVAAWIYAIRNRPSPGLHDFPAEVDQWIVSWQKT